MQNDLVEQWAKLSKNAIASMKELGQINSKILEKMTKQQQDILDTCLEASSKEMQLVTESKDPKELLSKQSALATEYNGKFIQIVQSTNELLNECKNDLTTWLEKNAEAAVAAFK